MFLLESEILNENITFVRPNLKNMKTSNLFSHKTPQNRHPSSWIHPQDNKILIDVEYAELDVDQVVNWKSPQ